MIPQLKSVKSDLWKGMKKYAKEYNLYNSFIVFAPVTVKKDGMDDKKNNDFDKCVIMDKSYKGNPVSTHDIFNVCNGDKIKQDAYNAKFMDKYDLKEDMVFEGRTFMPNENQEWRIYTHKLSKAKILAFFIYSWQSDPFSRFFIRGTYKDSVKNAYDLSAISVNGHNMWKVFNEHWKIESGKNGTWSCRLTSKDMEKEDFQKYFSKISNSIKVKSINVTPDKSGMHSHSRQDLHQYTVECIVEKPKYPLITMTQLNKKLQANISFTKGNKIYFIDEDSDSYNPAAKIVELKGGVIHEVYCRFSDKGLCGKKVKK